MVFQWIIPFQIDAKVRANLRAKNIVISVVQHTDRFVNFATKTYSTPSECCCTSNVSNTLSRMFPFFANRSDVPFKYSMSSR